MTAENVQDGVNSMVRREDMCTSARKLRDIYAMKTDAPFLRREFGYYCLERWYEQGLSKDANLDEVFDYDPPGNIDIMELGWCVPGYYPLFEEKLIEDRGEHEVIQDNAGRHKLVFKGRRQGFMPEYVDSPVKDMKTWQENAKWRLDPDSPERYEDLESRMAVAKTAAATGKMVTQRVVGGYMYLRSLIGPERLFYTLIDMPELIHDCMKTWLKLADHVTSIHQQHVTFDEIYFGEDICYNHGCLISPEMMKEFILPYYQQLIANVKSRQIDKQRHLYVQIDTDGLATPVISIYQEAIGMDVMSPFEVASGCDVVEIGKEYPDLVMTGGIDKRILAQSKEAIDKHLEYILPAMRKRGGYIPTCDHGVPEEVSLENYHHYRKRCVELGG